MLNTQNENQFQPGAITYFYESGKRNIIEAAGVISSGKNDPGGKSYGIYQLASKTGTLQNFIVFFKKHFKNFTDNLSYLNVFDHLNLASAEFDDKWRWLALQAPIVFANIQHAFIAETHFNPLINYLYENNISQEKITPAIQESLWSLGVQHGKAKLILQRVLAELITIIDELTFINCLYKHRALYVQQLSSLNAQMKANICARYQKESAEIINTLILHHYVKQP